MKEGLDKDKIISYFGDKQPGADSSYISKIFTDEANEKELKKILSGQFSDIIKDDELEKRDLDHILHRIHYEINLGNYTRKSPGYSRFVRLGLRIAAAILLPLLLLGSIYNYRGTKAMHEAWVEINSPLWTRTQFTLPDGTTGWLNSNSSLKYRGDFMSDRQVELSGEAFFDVYKNPKRPFIVNANEVIVKVLGTEFNLASYDNEGNVEVVLVEGRLLLTDRVKNESVTMNPDELVMYDKSSSGFTKETVQPHKFLSWTEGKLVFRNDPLDAVARRLERWYNVDVEIEGKQAVPTGEIRWRATFIDEELEEVLNLMKHSLPVDYRIEARSMGTDDTYSRKKVIIEYNSN